MALKEVSTEVWEAVKVRAFEAGKVCFPKVSLTGRRSLGEIGEDGGRGDEV